MIYSIPFRFENMTWHDNENASDRQGPQCIQHDVAVKLRIQRNVRIQHQTKYVQNWTAEGQQFIRSCIVIGQVTLEGLVYGRWQLTL